MARQTDVARGWTIMVVRLSTLVLFSLFVWMILRSVNPSAAFPPTMVWANLALLPVNVVCFVLVRRWYRADNKNFSDVLGIQIGRVGRDVLWGLLWLFVMNIPFSLVVAGTVFAMYGADAPRAFETIFYNANDDVITSPAWALAVAIISVIPFMLINAPTEELVYRGYALTGISRRFGPTIGVPSTSLLFGAQHVLFAASASGMLVYFIAFTVWGAIAAVIARRQGRLFPIVIAHWLINIMMSAPGIIFPALALAGFAVF
ncbi:lysostaphin resistance A-like protein [Microbacterium sp. YY-01]|uniref:CPBP family intramembrane glutamic endopeptidase n=1 Tax=Microbacterium sp. YY-01 TaxID=3421634 RepID=UPI003D16BA65